MRDTRKSTATNPTPEQVKGGFLREEGKASHPAGGPMREGELGELFSSRDHLLAKVYGRFIWILLILLPAFLWAVLFFEPQTCSLTRICLTELNATVIQWGILILLLMLIFQILERCLTGANMLLVLAFKKKHLEIRNGSHGAQPPEIIE